VCWFAARDLFDTLGGKVPVGAITQSYGGTSIQFWMSSEAIQQSDAPIATQCCGQNGGASCLWNTQVHPYTLGPMQFTAVLWYQGEQNANCGGPTQVADGVYSLMLQTLVRDWRLRFAQPSLVFGLVLLAAWQHSSDVTSFPLLRLAQANATNFLDATFLVSALDQGDPHGGSVHSPYKQEVGRRAALGIQGMALRQPVSYSGPRYRGTVSAPDGTLAVSFSTGGGALTLNSAATCPFDGSNCEAFAVLSAPDCVWRVANATLQGARNDMLLLRPRNWTDTMQAIATRGYFANWPLVHLRNDAGVPAVPWMEYIDSSLSPLCPDFLPTTTTTTTSTPCDAASPDTRAPKGFQAMSQQGWWANLTRAASGHSGTVAQCAALCEQHGDVCAGFHVWKPCNVGDCYVFLNGLADFVPHDGAFAYRRSPPAPSKHVTVV